MLINRLIQPLQAHALLAVVFDLDGTLCRYTMNIEQAMASSLQRVGAEEAVIGGISTAANRYNDLWYELQEGDHGAVPLRERIWIRLLSDAGVDDAELARQLCQVYVTLRTASLRLFDGASLLLADLRERYTLGLLTNGPSEMQWEKIELLKIKDSFDAIIVSGDVGVHKPDARVFTRMLRQIGAPPDKAIYVGNSYEMDIIGAHDAGMFSVWVNPDGEEEPQEGVADLRIMNVNEVRGILL